MENGSPSPPDAKSPKKAGTSDGPLVRAERGFYRLQMACGIIGICVGGLGLLAFLLASPSHSPRSAINAALGPSGFAAMLILGVLIARSAAQRLRSLRDRGSRLKHPGQRPGA